MTKRKGCPCWNNEQCEFNGFDCPAMDSCRHVEEKVESAREQESIRWATALNILIATESKRKDKESVDMVYAYRIAQVIESLRTHQEQPK